MDMTRTWGIECCKKFFGFTDADVRMVADPDGPERLMALWEESPDTYYANPLHLLRQEWWHAANEWYSHPGFWWTFPRGSVIADYGAGVGAVSLPGIMLGHHVELVELPWCALGYLRFKFGKCPNVRVMSCGEWWEEGLPVDGLVCVDVFEHIPEPLAIQEALWARLRPGGQALLKLEKAYPHEGHLEASCAQYPAWRQWLKDNTTVIEIENYAWVAKHE